MAAAKPATDWVVSSNDGARWRTHILTRKEHLRAVRTTTQHSTRRQVQINPVELDILIPKLGNSVFGKCSFRGKYSATGSSVQMDGCLNFEGRTRRFGGSTWEKFLGVLVNKAKLLMPSAILVQDATRFCKTLLKSARQFWGLGAGSSVMVHLQSLSLQDTTGAHCQPPRRHNKASKARRHKKPKSVEKASEVGGSGSKRQITKEPTSSKRSRTCQHVGSPHKSTTNKARAATQQPHSWPTRPPPGARGLVAPGEQSSGLAVESMPQDMGPPFPPAPPRSPPTSPFAPCCRPRCPIRLWLQLWQVSSSSGGAHNAQC